MLGTPTTEQQLAFSMGGRQVGVARALARADVAVEGANGLADRDDASFDGLLPMIAATGCSLAAATQMTLAVPARPTQTGR